MTAAPHTKETSSTTFRAKVTRYFLVSLVIVATLCVMILFVSPIIIQKSALTWLESQGIEDATIENIDLNIFTGSFTLEGLNIADDLSIGRITLDMDWWLLYQDKLAFRNIIISKVKGDLDQDKSKLWQLVYNIQNQGTETNPETINQLPAWKITLNHLKLNDIDFKVVGTFENQPFKLHLPLVSLELSQLPSDNDGNLQFEHKVQLGNVNVQGLGLALAFQTLNLKHQILSPTLDINFIEALSIKGLNLQVVGLQLQNTQENIQLLTAKKINLNQFSYAHDQGFFPLLSMHGITLPSIGKDSLGNIETIHLHQARLDFPKTYKLKALNIQGAQLFIHKLQDGRLQVWDKLIATSDNQASPVKNGQSPHWLIEQLTLDNTSSFTIKDESIQPTFKTTALINQFRLAPLDASKTVKTQIDLDVKINEYGSLLVQGDILPFANNLDTTLGINLNNMDLPRLSGYLEPRLGKSIQAGQLDLISSFHISNNNVDAQNKVKLRKLVLGETKQNKDADFGTGIPIETALSALRNDDDHIELEVPITGKLGDPNVNLDNAINIALQNAAQSGAISYAKIFLQPYGTLIIVSELAWDAAKYASKPKFTPITFKPQSSVLSEDMLAYIEKIALLMQQQTLDLQVCGLASRIHDVEDKAKLASNDYLLTLAEKRALVIQNVLLQQKVTADRFYHCSPSIDETKTAPHVDLIIN